MKFVINDFPPQQKNSLRLNFFFFKYKLLFFLF